MATSINNLRTMSMLPLFMGVAPLVLTTPAMADIVISTDATANMNCANGVCTPTAASAVLNVNDLESMLASANVDLAAAGEPVDVNINAALSWSGKNGLTLDSYRSIRVGAPVTVANGGLSLVTNDGGSGGAFSFAPGASIGFSSLAGSLAINGASYTLVADIKTLAADIANAPGGSYALAGNYDASQDGVYSESPIPTDFRGIFTGLGNTISKLTVHGSARNANLGLFAYVDSSGVVASVRITNADIKAKMDSSAGIVAGANWGTLFNDFSSGRVGGATGRSGDTGYGGLVGGSDGLIRCSGSTADVFASGNDEAAFADVGGLVGSTVGTVDQSYSAGAAIVRGGGAATSGGLAGFNNGVLENSYAKGDSAIEDSGDVGGLVGENGFTISDAYSTGGVSGVAEGDTGGSIGYDGSAEDGGTLSNDYWDTKTSGIRNLSQGAGNIPNDPGITGETTVELKAGLPAGFDPTIWAEDKKINKGLPYLIANPPG